ncbi:MAG: ribonuclease D, partial [Proteobacteria bacterium SW_6_67_9]
DALSALVRLRAAEHELNAATLVDRKRLAQLAQGTPITEVLSGWRYHVVGATLEAFLAGHTSLARGTGGTPVVTSIE